MVFLDFLKPRIAILKIFSTRFTREGKIQLLKKCRGGLYTIFLLEIIWHIVRVLINPTVKKDRVFAFVFSITSTGKREGGRERRR